MFYDPSDQVVWGNFYFRESYYYEKTKDIFLHISINCIVRRARLLKGEYVGELQEEILEHVDI